MPLPLVFFPFALALALAFAFGAAFAFSSIAVCGSLPWNNSDNNISTLVGNVLNRFMKDGPLPMPEPVAIMHRGRADYDQPMNKARK